METAGGGRQQEVIWGMSDHMPPNTPSNPPMDFRRTSPGFVLLFLSAGTVVVSFTARVSFGPQYGWNWSMNMILLAAGAVAAVGCLWLAVFTPLRPHRVTMLVVIGLLALLALFIVTQSETEEEFERLIKDIDSSVAVMCCELARLWVTLLAMLGYYVCAALIAAGNLWFCTRSRLKLRWTWTVALVVLLGLAPWTVVLVVTRLTPLFFWWGLSLGAVVFGLACMVTAIEAFCSKPPNQVAA
jgi:hypothetical protein